MIGCEGGIWPVDDLGRAKNQFLQHRGSSKDVIEPGITIRLGPMLGPSVTTGILAWNHGSQYGIVDLQEPAQSGRIPVVIQITYYQIAWIVFRRVRFPQIIPNGPGLLLSADSPLGIVFTFGPLALEV